MPMSWSFLKSPRSGIIGHLCPSKLLCTLFCNTSVTVLFSCTTFVKSGWLRVIHQLQPLLHLHILEDSYRHFIMKQRPPAESMTWGIAHVGYVSSYHVTYFGICLFIPLSSFLFPVFLIFMFLLGTDICCYWLYHMPQAAKYFKRHIHHSDS